MLKRLYVENFALVEKLEVEFQPGMNVLTGETGAGKSIIVGAIGRLLGEKSDKDDIRSGAKLAVIEGEFSIAEADAVRERAMEYQIDVGDEDITLRRELPSKGNSRYFLDGRLVGQAQFRKITEHLAELFGQHSHQQLLDEDNHLLFLDRFASLTDEAGALTELFSLWVNVRKELASLESRREREKNERELMIFQKEEIEKGKIRIGEEQELLAEKKILDSSRLLGEKASNIINALELNDNSALSMLNHCRKELSQMAALDKQIEKYLQLLEEAIVNLDELRSDIESYRSNIPDDPRRQEEINLRLDEIFRLKKKYGGSEESILTNLSRITDHLGANIDIDAQIKILQKEEAGLAEQYKEGALRVSSLRGAAAGELSKRVVKELKKLSIDQAKFEFEFLYEDSDDGIELHDRRVKPGPLGLESGRFMISANPGEPVKPLSKTASGGEISRIMLALKAADRRPVKNGQPLLVLDEIDSGIGGATANAVAKELAALSKNYQLLVVTHLHQIAAAADHHFAVEKSSSRASGGRNLITLQRLNDKDRRKEIERMISLPSPADA